MASKIKTTFALTFGQDAACGYAETITIKGGLPDFVSYDEAARNFVVFTDDISNAGSSTLAVEASIQVP